jgi:hypothetical protein
MILRDFLVQAREAYLRCIRRTLEWMLERPRLHGAFLNTKRNSLTLRDYGPADGWRGPDILYGWIQGRGLEALVAHAQFFGTDDPAFAAALREAAEPLYRALADLHARDGHAYFAYGSDLQPIRPGPGGEAVQQGPAGDLFTYSDAFVAKGLVAASKWFDPSATAGHRRSLAAVAQAVEEDRFLVDERQPLTPAALAVQPAEFGPRMILLGAAAMLRRLGYHEDAAFGGRFIAHAIREHADTDPGSPSFGLIRDVPGRDASNVGHAIEFVGFALDYLPPYAEPALIGSLQRTLLISFEAGFAEPGLCLSVSAVNGAKLSPYYPWWSLPEAIRAAALAYRRTRNMSVLAVWREAHNAFFAHYWRDGARLAYQTRTVDGPVDYVPATPDLDPGYHTGLSLLATIEVIDALLTPSDSVE